MPAIAAAALEWQHEQLTGTGSQDKFSSVGQLGLVCAACVGSSCSH
jgi:hypothetical protein